MATQRKSGSSRSKAKKAKQAARKSAAKVRPKRASARAVSRKAAAKPAPKARPRPVVAKSPKLAKAAKPNTATSGVGSKAVVVKGKSPRLVPAAEGARRLGMKPAPGKPAPPVRPLGVLPPEAIARGTHRAPTLASRPPERSAPRPTREDSPDEGAPGVSEQDYQDFEERLLAERQKILKEMGHLESTVLKVNQRESAGDLSGYSFHMADVGTDAMEREKAFLFASTEGRLLMEIDEALRRVYRSEFGSCETCGKSISRARLEAMPYARLCLSCKDKEERGSRGAS